MSEILHMNLGKESYDIVVERGALYRVGELLNLDRRVLIVTDEGVPPVYAETVAEACAEPIIVTYPQGEDTKSFEVLADVCAVMLENGFTRTDCVVAVGGVHFHAVVRQARAICHNRKGKHHLVYLGVAISADGKNFVAVFVQKLYNLFRRIRAWQVVSRSVVKQVAKK